MQTNLSSYNNGWYNPGGNVIKRITWHYINCFIFKSGYFPFYKLKTFLLRMFGATVGSGVLIKPFVNIKYPWKLSLGNNIWIGENVWIDNIANVIIGNNVCISQGAFLLTGNHNYKKQAFDLILGEVILEDGVWIGAQSVVCPGVICESHAVLSVASVANQNLSAFNIYTGNPAKKVRERVMEK